jgi:hypothetical protein
MTPTRPLRVLGIETSCDETAAAIVDGDRRILSDRVLSQTGVHTYGGIVPEIAARALEHLDGLIARPWPDRPVADRSRRRRGDGQASLIGGSWSA